MQYTYKNVDGVIKDLDFSDHICSIYQNKMQQFSQIIPFLADGLKRNEKCVYIYDDSTPEIILLEFEKLGIKTDRYIESKQLTLVSKDNSYLQGGQFDIEKMVLLLEEIITSTLSDGYEGVRGTGEMLWMLDMVVGAEKDKKLVQYESRVNELYANRKIKSICQYDENKFSHETLINIIRTHRFIIIYGKVFENKYFYSPPEYSKQGMIAFPANSYRTIIDTIIEE